MNMLQDIQNNPIEENIKFHMIRIIGLAMMSTFQFDDNEKKMKNIAKHWKALPDLKATIMGQAWSLLVEEYLTTDTGENKEEKQGMTDKEIKQIQDRIDSLNKQIFMIEVGSDFLTQEQHHLLHTLYEEVRELEEKLEAGQ